MQSNDTDEIICSNCGRPNLPEANKCWYCQSSLNKDAILDTETGEPEGAGDPFEKQAGQPEKKPAPAPEASEDVPEWLKRIREKEQKVREAETARDQWQQQGLFGNSSPAKPAPAQRKRDVARPEPVESRKPTIKESSHTKPALETTPPVKSPEKKPDIPAVKPVDDPVDDPADQPDELTGELPDGFVRFDSKSQ